MPGHFRGAGVRDGGGRGGLGLGGHWFHRRRGLLGADLSSDADFVAAVRLRHVDLDDLLARCRHVLAHVVGADGQLAMAAVDQDGQADGPRPPEVDQGIHRAANGSAGIQHVVDEDDRGAVEVEGQVRALDDGLLGDQREVVAVEGDVECADGDAHALVFLDRVSDPPRERYAAPLDADEGQVLRTRLLLDDLVGDPDDSSPDLIVRHDLAVGHRMTLPGTGALLLPGLTVPVVKGSAKDTALSRPSPAC